MNNGAIPAIQFPFSASGIKNPKSIGRNVAQLMVSPIPAKGPH